MAIEDEIIDELKNPKDDGTAFISKLYSKEEMEQMSKERDYDESKVVKEIMLRLIRYVAEKGRKEERATIIQLADQFECCPECGNTEIQSHWCPKCKKEFAMSGDAGWFAKHLKDRNNIREAGL